MSSPANPTGTAELSPELEHAKLVALRKADEIADALTKNDPLLPMHCKNMLDELRQHEELVHILPDEKIKFLLSGMQKYMAIELAKEAAGKKTRGKVTVDDI